MQGAEHQVAGFGGGDRQLDRLQIAQLPHQDHVRVLAQGGPQGIGEAAGVVVELALMHHALYRFVGEFDRIFDREDVLSPVLVDVIEDGGEGGGLARAGGTGHQHQPLGGAADLLHDRWQPQHRQLGNAVAQRPQTGGIGAALAIDIDPEACHALEAVGAVELPGLLQLLALGIVEHREDQPVAGFLIQHLLLDRPELSVEAAVGGQAGADVQIAAAIGHQLGH